MLSATTIDNDNYLIWAYIAVFVIIGFVIYALIYTNINKKEQMANETTEKFKCIR